MLDVQQNTLPQVPVVGAVPADLPRVGEEGRSTIWLRLMQ